MPKFMPPLPLSIAEGSSESLELFKFGVINSEVALNVCIKMSVDLCYYLSGINA